MTTKRIYLIVALVAAFVLALVLLKTGDKKSKDNKSQVTSKAKPKTKTKVKRRTSRTSAVPGGVPEVSADDDPVGTLRLEGQVVDDAGRGVAKAKVLISSRPKKTTVTDGDGSFHFDKLVGRTYAVYARVDDLVGGPVMHKLTDNSDPVVVKVSRGATITVKVLGERDKPLANAEAKIEQAELDATTNAKGIAVLRGVHPGYSPVVVSATGYAPSTELVQVPDSPGVKLQRTIKLRKGVPVSGVVVNENGVPVKQASVVAISASSLVKTRASAVAKTNDKGEFKLPAVATGAYRLIADHKEYVGSSSEVISVYETELSNIKLIVKSGATISGRVVDDAGTAVPWATVRTATSRGDFEGDGNVRETTADDKGEFVVRRLKRVGVKILAKNESASSAPTKIDLGKTKHVKDIELKLDIKGTISGTVVDGEGEGIAEVQVTAIPDFWSGESGNGFRVRGLATATTSGDGSFTFRGLPDGKYRLKPVRRRITDQMFQRPGKQAKTGDTDVKLVMLDEGGISGKLAFDNGDAVKVFTVTVTVPPGVPVADKKGRFQLTKLAPGKQTVSFRGEGFATLRKTIDISPGKVNDLGTLTVKKGRSVSGRVVDSGGSPVAKAKVTVARQLLGDGSAANTKLGGARQEAIRSGTTDDDGYYQIMGIGANRRYIVAEDDKLGRSLPYVISAGTHSPRLDIRLQPFGSLKGKITMNGTPAQKTNVIVTPKNTDGGQFVVVQTDDKGMYSVARLPAGQHRVLAMVGGGGNGGGGNNSSKGGDVTVAAGAEATLDIALTSGDITLDVMVTARGSAQVDAAQVILAEGTVAIKNGLEAQRGLLSGSVSGKIVTTLDLKKPAKFKKVNPGAYTVCVIPITGDITDPTFGQKLGEHTDKLKVYCTPHTVKASPNTQTHTVSAPAMEPLP